MKLVELRRKIEKESDPEAKAKKTKMAENLENYMLKLTTNFMFAQWEDAIAEYIKEIG